MIVASSARFIRMVDSHGLASLRTRYFQPFPNVAGHPKRLKQSY